MFAVIKDGGRQFTVQQGDRVLLDLKQGVQPGDEIRLDQVLLVKGEGDAQIGTPTVAGAAVIGKVLEVEHKGPKVIAFKKRRRKDSKSKQGHRQRYTAVTIDRIEG